MGLSAYEKAMRDEAVKKNKLFAELQRRYPQDSGGRLLARLERRMRADLEKKMMVGAEQTCASLVSASDDDEPDLVRCQSVKQAVSAARTSKLNITEKNRERIGAGCCLCGRSNFHGIKHESFVCPFKILLAKPGRMPDDLADDKSKLRAFWLDEANFYHRGAFRHRAYTLLHKPNSCAICAWPTSFLHMRMDEMGEPQKIVSDHATVDCPQLANWTQLLTSCKLGPSAMDDPVAAEVWEQKCADERKEWGDAARDRVFDDRDRRCPFSYAFAGPTPANLDRIEAMAELPLDAM